MCRGSRHSNKLDNQLQFKAGKISVYSPDLPTAPQSFLLCNSHLDAQ